MRRSDLEQVQFNGVSNTVETHFIGVILCLVIVVIVRISSDLLNRIRHRYIYAVFLAWWYDDAELLKFGLNDIHRSEGD